MSTERPETAPGLHSVRTGPRGAPPVVLLHPAGLDLTYWGEQIAALGGSHDLIALDYPGHGRSGVSAGSWTLEGMAAAIAVLLDEVGAERAHLVGISVGGMIAQVFALSYPQRVASLSLIATASEFPEPARQGMRDRARRLREGGISTVIDETMQRWFTPQTAMSRPDLLDRATTTLLQDDVETHAQLWEGVAAFDTTTRLSEVRCPTLILAGEVDPSCPPSAAGLMQARVQGSRLVILPKTSHMAILESAALVTMHLAGFFAQLTPGAGFSETVR